MKFVDLLKESKTENKTEVTTSVKNKHQAREVVAESKSAEDLLRSSGYKIKMVTRTSFGTQIDLFKKPEQDDIEKILKEFNIKIKDKSIFVVD